jgi:aspartate/methionine/tyrosine aminotransferase
MAFKRMEIERWFDRYQYETEFDIGESGVKYLKLNELDIDLGEIPLRYGHHYGDPQLREQILQDYPGFGIDNLLVTNGAGEAIFTVIASLVSPDEQVIVEFPNFPSLYEVPLSLDRDVKFAQLRFENRFQLDTDELIHQIEPRTKLIVLTHPNNPTGSNISLDDLEKLVEVVESKNIYLLMDETYREMTFGQSLPPAALLSDRVISITSMSKTFSIPGVRIGWIAANRELNEFFVATREQVTICNSIISERIAHLVLQRKDEILEKNRAITTKNLEILRQWIEPRNDLEWIPPEGGVVAFPRIVGGISSQEVCQHLIETYKTFVVPGYVFGMPEYLRIGFGSDTDELIEGLSRLDKTLNYFFQ